MTATAPCGGPLRLLVLQPTPYCNLDCDYCYLPSRNDRSRLSLDILDAALGGYWRAALSRVRSPCSGMPVNR